MHLYSLIRTADLGTLANNCDGDWNNLWRRAWRQTEEQLRKAAIGEPEVINSSITITEYDPIWPTFALEADRIRAALDARVLRLEHVAYFPEAVR